MSVPENIPQLFRIIKNNAQIHAGKETSCYREGRWEKQEKINFIKGCLMFGNDWKKVKELVKTRKLGQIRSHAQKFILQICKNQNAKNKEFMDNIKKLDFKSRNYSQLFNDDFHLLSKDHYTPQEMDEIERKIIIKFKINYSKEYECLNPKPEDPESNKESLKRRKKRARIKTFDNFSVSCDMKGTGKDYRSVLLKKINQHINKLRKLAFAYQSLYGNPIEPTQEQGSCQVGDSSTKEGEQSVKSIVNYASNDEELLNSFDLHTQNPIFSLFNVDNVDQYCSRSYISSEEDLVYND